MFRRNILWVEKYQIIYVEFRRNALCYGFLKLLLRFVLMEQFKKNVLELECIILKNIKL